VVDHLNLIDRHVFLYLMLNDKTNIAGVYELSLKTMSNETGIEQNDLISILRRLQPKVYYTDNWIVLSNFIKNQNYKSPKIKTGIEMVLETCPNNLLEYINWPVDWKIPENIAKRLNKQGSLLDNGYGMDTVSHSNTNTNTNTNTNSGLDMVYPTADNLNNKKTKKTNDPKLGKRYRELIEQKKSIGKDLK
jgi:hypothetical protein